MRSVTRVRMVLVALAAVLVLPAAPAQAQQQLVAVEPANGASVTGQPTQAVLTFAQDVDEALVSVQTPQGSSQVRAQVAGGAVTVPVAADGPGQYVVDYRVLPGQAQGQTGFTVLGAGEQPPPAPQRSPYGTVWTLLVVGGLVAALVMTVTRWRRG